jgi:cytochrome c biogenesis factor
MTATVGVVATWAAIAALVGAGGLAAARRGGPALVSARVGAALAALAVGCVGWALATGDFSLAYVAAVSDRSTSWPYRVAGIWGGMGGSLLLWAALVAAWGTRRRLATGERAALVLLAAAFLVVDAVWATPFHRLAAPAIDGLGATPILRHPAMLYHPPILYLGLTGLVAPWAAVVGGGAEVRVRRTLLLCVGLLTVGMVAGAHWAYVELGWGGYWAWDPVENTALLPWLAALGALHGLVARRRHGRPGGATSLLATAGLVLAVGGTLLTRSGAAPSVHAFGEDRAVGWALLAVLVGVAVATGAALVRRRPPLEAIAPPRADRREVLAVAAQPWLAGFAVLVVLLGTVRPLVGDGAVAVDGSYYATLLAPVGVVAVVLLLRFRPTHLAHVGAVVLAIGFAASTRSSTASATLGAGESLRVAGWEVRNDGVRLDGEREVVAEVVLLRGGDERARLGPSLVAYPERGVLLPETSLRSTPLGDVQVALRDADDDGRALLEVHVRPLVWFVWWGGLLIGASALWGAARIRPPERAERSEP